ncbi:MAG: hypothetical protein OXI18_06635 [bacterium]|nr:hypothetical protein [bacterium]
MDAGTLDPEAGREDRDHRLRRIAAEVAGVSIIATRHCYLALRRCSLNPVAPTGVAMVAYTRRALGPVEIEKAAGAPVLAAIPFDHDIALAADDGGIAQLAWKESVEQLRSLVVPAEGRIKQIALEASAAEPKEWCSWWNRDQRRRFLSAASWGNRVRVRRARDQRGIRGCVDRRRRRRQRPRRHRRDLPRPQAPRLEALAAPQHL